MSHARPRRTHRNPSAAVLAAAVVLALVAGSGGAVAGALITGKQIKNESVTGADLRNGTVGSADIADRSLGSQDVANGSLGSADLSTSARQELAGSLASGRVAADATVSRVRTARGIAASATRAEPGVYCVVLTGTAVSSDEAVLVAVATEATTIVVADPAAPSTACPQGAWTVRTHVRLTDGSITASDEPFVFQIG